MTTDSLDENPFGYGTLIWRLFQDAPRAGTFPEGEVGVVSGQAGTPAARSVLRIQLRVIDGLVTDARFRAYGCPTSIAVGAWIADWAIGKRAEVLAGLNLAQLREALEIPDDRAHCALMGEDALKAALRALRQEPVP